MGLRIVRKPAEPKAPRPADLSSTSKARAYMHDAQKSGNAETISAAEKLVLELYPDMLTTRRQLH